MMISDLRMLGTMTKRHMKLFFKDKAGMFFSLLSPLIILLLYALFLNKSLLDTMNKTIEKFSEGGDSFAVSSALLQSSIIAAMLSGVLGIATVTVALSAQNRMVRDREEGMTVDALVSPVRRGVVSASYWLYTFLITMSICGIMLVISFIYLAITGWYLSAGAVFCIIGVTVLGAIASTVAGQLLCAFLKTGNAHGAFIGIVSSVGGFLFGVYMPLGQMPEAVRYIALFFPPTYIGTVLRNLFMAPVLAEIGKTAPPQFIDGLKSSWTTSLDFFGAGDLAVWQEVLIVLGFIVFIGIANILIVSHRSKRKERKMTNDK